MEYARIGRRERSSHSRRNPCPRPVRTPGRKPGVSGGAARDFRVRPRRDRCKCLRLRVRPRHTDGSDRHDGLLDEQRPDPAHGQLGHAGLQLRDDDAGGHVLLHVHDRRHFRLPLRTAPVHDRDGHRHGWWATTATATATATTATATAASSASSAACGPLRRPEGARAAPRSREAEAPAAGLLGRAGASGSLEPSRARHWPAPAARRNQAARLSGRAHPRPSVTAQADSTTSTGPIR
jgi:hypothetical protein